MATLRERFDVMPRAIRWALIATVAFVGYFVYDSVVLSWMTRLNEQAMRDESQLDTLREREADRAAAVSTLGRGVARFGNVAFPTSDAVLALDTTVNAILASHDITGVTMTAREPMPLRGDVLLEHILPGQMVMQYRKQLRFEASPERAAQVLAALERAPEVTAVGHVVLRVIDREDAGEMLQVELVPEAWVLGKQEARR